MKTLKLFTLILSAALTLSACGSSGSSASAYSMSSSAKMALTSPGIDAGTWQKSSDNTWQTLQHTPIATLQEQAGSNQDPSAKAWLDLAVISKQYSTNTQQLVQELQKWRESNPSHPGNSLFPNNGSLNDLATQSTPHHVALLLPLDGPLSASGQAVRAGFLSAYYANKNPNGEKIALSFYDTSENKDLTALYQKAADEGADLIVGPLTKQEVEGLFGVNQFKVRVLALNYTQTSFFHSLPGNFYEFGLAPEEEVKQMANKARQAGLSNALILTPDDEWGQRVADSLTSQWQTAGGKVTDQLNFNNRMNLTQAIAKFLHVNPKKDRRLMREENNRQTLAEQRRQDFDVIFVFAQPEMGRQLVPLLRFYYAGNVPFYSISSIYSGKPNPAKDKDLNGVTFCEIPWLIQMAHAPLASANQYNKMYAVGRDAFLLSQALPRLDAMPNFPIYGATGALAMDQQRIHQRLPWVTMRDGQI